MNLVFATHNPHKLEEASLSLGPDHLVTSLTSLGWSKEIPETADTLLGNAILKARTVFRDLGRDCFADDTGLEIEALQGRPGVLTARFAGLAATAKENRDKTLSLMAQQKNRQAVFRTVIVLILDGREHVFEGRVSGEITTSERGNAGFGYDSIFQPSGFTETYAEMPIQQRSQMSHRALAMVQLRDFLDRSSPQSRAPREQTSMETTP